MLSELIVKFATNYLAATSTPFAGNREADVIRYELPELIRKLAAIPLNYKVYGSVGQGQWAEVPWFAILDKDITTSTQKGYYVVFLFSADMKYVYPSLGVGWQQFEEEYGVREGRIAIEQVVRELQRILRSPLDDFSFAKRDLKATSILGKGYESGGVCHKVYEIEKMPSDEVIVNDVRNLMGVYRELKGLVGKNVLNLEIPEEQIADEEFNRKVIEESEDVASPEVAKEKIKALTKIIETAPAQERTKMARYVARNRKFAELVKQAANYTCQICGMPPFKTKSGELYAEAHHTLELATHRIDHPDIMICVCAQCHRVITYGSEAEISKREDMGRQN